MSTPDRMEAIEKAISEFGAACAERSKSVCLGWKFTVQKSALDRVDRTQAALLFLVREAVQADPANAIGWCCHCTKNRATTTRLLSTSLCEPCAATVDGSSVTPTTDPEHER